MAVVVLLLSPYPGPELCTCGSLGIYAGQGCVGLELYLSTVEVVHEYPVPSSVRIFLRESIYFFSVEIFLSSYIQSLELSPITFFSAGLPRKI